MGKTPRPAPPRMITACRPRRARGPALAVYCLVGGLLAVAVSSAVAGWAGGNALDRLAPFGIVVLLGGWYAAPILRWLRSLRR